MKITVKVDGTSYTDEVEPRTLLVHYLRESLGKTGTVVGCDTSNCGACTVHLDGRSVKSCNVLAVQANGRTVTTIEGLAATAEGDLHPVQEWCPAERAWMTTTSSRFEECLSRSSDDAEAYLDG